MTAILAQMERDAVAAGVGDEAGGAHRVGMVAAAGVPEGGDVIDVDAEAEPVHARNSFRRGRGVARL
jgi:hypothetical protein